MGGGKYLIAKAISLQTSLTDYKFFCFSGKVEFFKVDYDRYIHHTANYYDKNANFLNAEEVGFEINESKLQLPANLDKMITVAEILAKDFPFVRVDLYNIDGRIYFGELTFYPGSGYGTFRPDSYDFKFGKYFNNTRLLY